MSSVEPGVDLAQWSLEQARAAGADAAEVLIVSGETLSAGVRMGEVEKLKSSRERRLGVRVFVGKSSATASTAEFERKALGEFVADTVRLARLTAPDQWSGLPDPALHPSVLPELELSDPSSGIIDADRALEIARTAERAALGADSRIKNSEGAEFDSGYYRVVFANNQGFAGEYAGTSYGLAVAPIAEENGAMQPGHWYTQNRRFDGLEDAASVGLTSARRALRKLGARKIKTMRAPIVFDPDMAAGLLRALAGAASGPSLYRGASFLVGRLGTEVANAGVTIIDDGTMRGGLGSKPFDGEVLPITRKNLVERGALGSARNFECTVSLDDPACRIGKLEFGQQPRMKRRIGQPRPLVGRGQTRQAHRVGDELAQRLALELGGRRRGRRLSDEHAHTQPPLARTLEFFDLAHAHAGAERLGADDQNLGGVGTRGPRLFQAPLSQIHARFNSRFN